MLKQKVISQKLSLRNNRVMNDNNRSDYKHRLYMLKYEKSKSITNMNYGRIKEMENNENELLEKLKQT